MHLDRKKFIFRTSFPSLIFRRLAITLCCVLFPVLLSACASAPPFKERAKGLIGLDEKELLENSIDAGSKNIHLIIKNSGKKLIKVIDDGSGMSKEDAKLCFEKHATSKIKNINDISNILTMGFRGEALASIASVSKVEMKTKKSDESIGTQVFIENSKINKITETACNNGTSITVKNLFFNIPARKNFLKSDRIELKHVYEIFIQISLANPKIIFKLTNDNKVVFNLPLQNLKNRIIQIFGKK